MSLYRFYPYARAFRHWFFLLFQSLKISTSIKILNVYRVNFTEELNVGL